jgi:Calcium binding
MKQRKGTKRKHQRSSSRRSSTSPSRLEQMISEAIVDCYNDSEQAMGLFDMIEQKLCLPFSTVVLGIQVTVEKIDLNEAGQIVAVCARGPERQRIPIVDLPLPSVRPEGAEWIEAYRRWAQGR